MPKQVYSYHPITKEFCGICLARESPEDLKQGKIVWHIPGYATEIAPPESKSGYLTIWDGKNWIQNKIPQITKIIERKLCNFIFENEVKAIFPDVKIEGNLDSKISRSITFLNIQDTPENNIKLNSIISSHILPDSNIDQSNKITLAIVETFCEELQKIGFPNFKKFKQLVNKKLEDI